MLRALRSSITLRQRECCSSFQLAEHLIVFEST